MVFFIDKTPDVTQLALDLLWKDVHPVSESKEDKPIVKPRYEPLFSLSEIVHPIQQNLETKQSTLFLPETIDYVRSELRRVKQQESNRRYYLKNREKELARTREWRKNNSEIIKIRDKEYYSKNRERILNIYRDRKQEHQNRARRYYLKHRDRVLARTREWRQKNRERVNLLARLRYHKTSSV